MHAAAQPTRPTRTARTAIFVLCGALALAATATACDDPEALYAETFDTHWERLRDDYPYFELYGVDWEAEREEHRPRALAAANPDEFAWELARMILVLDDPHVSFLPSLDTITKWSVPDLDTHRIGRRSHVLTWPDADHGIPAAFADDPHAYPEIVSVCGEPAQGVVEILAGGPPGSSFEIEVRWPDGSETSHELQRPEQANVAPKNKHLGTRWLITGRVGEVGYMHVRTFDPSNGTMGPDGKMTTMLRAALAELADTEALILDFQDNGGGLVTASDPFLGNLVERRLSYLWGNAKGQRRVIRPRQPRYRGQVVALVNERSASGGEWAARILRDAGRATVVGGPTVGAEAAVGTSTGADGSVLSFSEWPMIEPGRPPFQATGIELDHTIPLTIEDAREHGLDEALRRVRRARFAKALEILGAPASDLDAFLELAESGSEDPSGGVTKQR